MPRHAGTGAHATLQQLAATKNQFNKQDAGMAASAAALSKSMASMADEIPGLSKLLPIAGRSPSPVFKKISNNVSVLESPQGGHDRARLMFDRVAVHAKAKTNA